MNNPVPGFSDGNNERKASLLRSLNDFTKEHRAAHWAGTFASFLEQIFPNDARSLARTSHQYIWDMMRARASTTARVASAVNCSRTNFTGSTTPSSG